MEQTVSRRPSNAQMVTEVRERLIRKYPSMSQQAIDAAVRAAQNTLEGRGAPRLPKPTPRIVEALTGDTNRLSGRADDARKRGRR